MNLNKILAIVFGIIIILSAFFSVFGKNAISRLFVDDDIQLPDVVLDTNIKPVETLPVSTTPLKSPVKATPTLPAPVENTNNVPPVNDIPTTPSYTLSQIQSHNSATSCYSAINNKVYDLTSWVNRHPGGKATILMICGKDGSALFNAQHKRSSRVADILSGFYIGDLK